MKLKIAKKSLLIFGLVLFIVFAGVYFLFEQRGTKNGVNANGLSFDEELAEEVESNEKGWSRSSNEAGVMIEAIFSNPNEANEEGLKFEIYMDTHDGNLLKLEIEEIAEIKSNHGIVAEESISWEWVQESSHHPSGRLEVENQTEKEQELVDDSTIFIEVKLKDINGANHKFRWDL